MEYIIKEIHGGKLRLEFSLTSDERIKFEDRVLKRLAVETNIPGFRPGKAPVDLVRAKFNDDVINNEIMMCAVREYYFEAVREKKLETIGQPDIILVSKIPFVIAATVTKLPKVDLGKWEQIKIIPQPVELKLDEVDKALADLRDSRASEVAVVRPAILGDKVEIDFTVSLDKVIIDGGQATKYPVVLGKNQLVVGFENNIVGMEIGNEKNFTVVFPIDYRKDLAGKKADVHVKLHNIWERVLPEFNNEFIGRLGKFESLDDLRKKLADNIIEDHKLTEDLRVERAMLDELINCANFGEIPELLVNSELDKMIHELSNSITERGVVWIDYLKTINKTEESLRVEFKLGAEKRVKIALIIRAFAKLNNLEASDEEVTSDIAKLLEHYNNDERVVAQLNNDDYRQYIGSMLTNKKVIDWLKERLVKI